MNGFTNYFFDLPWRLIFDLYCSISSPSSQGTIDQSLSEMTKVCKMYNVDVLFHPPLHTSGYYIRDDWCKGEFMGLEKKECL